MAKRLEHAAGELVEQFGRGFSAGQKTVDVYTFRLGGGVAVLAGPGCPFNKVAGLGFAPLADADLAQVEEVYARARLPLQAEVSTLADPEIHKRLTGRGYRLVGFENVLGCDLRHFQPDATAPGIAVRQIDPHEASDWIDVVTTGFAHPDTFDGPASHESFERDALREVFAATRGVGGMRQYLALRDGAIAGGASMRVSNGIAQLCGASTLPAHRRRGVQTTLLLERLKEAVREGCDIAEVTTQPGSKSQENVQRQGFSLLYARAILVRDPVM